MSRVPLLANDLASVQSQSLAIFSRRSQQGLRQSCLLSHHGTQQQEHDRPVVCMTTQPHANMAMHSSSSLTVWEEHSRASSTCSALGWAALHAGLCAPTLHDMHTWLPAQLKPAMINPPSKCLLTPWMWTGQGARPSAATMRLLIYASRAGSPPLSPWLSIRYNNTACLPARFSAWDGQQLPSRMLERPEGLHTQ